MSSNDICPGVFLAATPWCAARSRAPVKVLVTAGAGGIGLAIARLLLRMALRSMWSILMKPRLRPWQRVNGHPVRPLRPVRPRCDRGMVPRPVKVLGGLDVLVNNAASRTDRHGGRHGSDDWEAVMAINLNCTFNVTRLAIPHLKKSNSASIIIMSSAAGALRVCQSQCLLDQQVGSDWLHQDFGNGAWRYGIRVNAILPGAVAGQEWKRVLAGRARISGAHWNRNASRRWQCSPSRHLSKPPTLPSGGVSGLRCRQGDLPQTLPIDNDTFTNALRSVQQFVRIPAGTEVASWNRIACRPTPFAASTFALQSSMNTHSQA